MADERRAFIDAVAADLLGPAAGDREVLAKARPGDRYLTGILCPDQPEQLRDEVNAEQDDDRDEPSDDEAGPDVPVSMTAMRKPSSMGLSFAMHGRKILLWGQAARYRRRWQSGNGLVDEDLGRENERWVREPLSFSLAVDVVDGLVQHPAAEGLCWWVRAVPAGSNVQVTVVLENRMSAAPGRVEMEESSFFQAGFRVRAAGGARLVSRRPAHLRGRSSVDADLAASLLIYRDVEEWAVGHTCAATWGQDDEGRYVEATWLPEQHVPSMSADGHPVFSRESTRITGKPEGAFLASALASAPHAQLVKMLEVLPVAYRDWIAEQQKRVTTLEAMLQGQAQQHLDEASWMADRMRTAISLLERDALARRAFQMAQEAMVLQRRWSTGRDSEKLQWRPFQLAFQLLALVGLVETDDDGKPSEERLAMDLLWFPTGGGKTEAYLGLIAFLLFHRRLRQGQEPDRGAGVAAIMRYTLRLLTVQQFERASRMVLACEFLRKQFIERKDASLGSLPFGIGLWVGSEATPNSLEDARSSLDEADKARQLVRCPACRSKKLLWDRAGSGPSYTVECENPACPMHGGPLPIFTIDELIYQERPSLVVGTVDKFAQIVRNPHTTNLLGAGALPPDLILQDELHLISGPLGTVVGLYEAAIDRICTRAGIPPKVIGSTATIRRAQEQVRGLFDRSVAQFPPPAIDWNDSCFAVLEDRVPGRVYVGVTTAGRSPKFTLQAVCGAAMQRADAAEEILKSDVSRDPYWTLLAYFNSMRELGGALVMMLDDVNDSMAVYASSHGKAQRSRIEEPIELTSRVPSHQIPAILNRLEKPLPEQDVSVVLATNMISVGVDIPRLGLMVVNGQPKSMAEYIQASSRVGRNEVPGLIFTVYNAGRTRDRAHYESFRTWHQALYRDVEATSVTPFAPRARDKALHAAVVAIARHLVPGMRDNEELTEDRRDELESYAHALYNRAQSVDPGEADETRKQISDFLGMWASRGKIGAYWNDYKPATSLLASAERVAAARAVEGRWTHAALPTPNSMREVEPSVRFRMISGLSTNQDSNVQGDSIGNEEGTQQG
jgi:hypothetical protein